MISCILKQIKELNTSDFPGISKEIAALVGELKASLLAEIRKDRSSDSTDERKGFYLAKFLTCLKRDLIVRFSSREIPTLISQVIIIVERLQNDL